MTTSSAADPTPDPMLEQTSQQGGLLRLMIDRPVTVIVGIILTIAFGLAAVLRLPIQLTPDITVPTITVSTVWPGASPLEVEADLVQPQEDALKTVQGLTTMTSESRFGQGSITLEFEVGTPLSEALVRVSNSLSQVPNSPLTARRPVVATANSAGPPLAVIIIRSQRTGQDVASYRTWVEREIVPELERIPGVADTRLRGGQDREVHIDFEPAALAARDLSVPALAARVRDQLRDLSAGDMTVGKRRLLVRTLVSPDRLEAFEDIVLGAGPAGEPVMLRDVARVSYGLRKADSFVIANDTPAMALILQREAGTNVLEVTEALKATIEQLNRERFAPEGLIIEIVSEQSGYIKGALALVQSNLLIGAALAVLVLLLFLRSVGSSVIISVSIPICVFGTALGMTLFGRTVNVVSLAGITFAIGMVVDNSIVALENIDTWRSRVGSAKEAAYQGVKEVWGALLASTATTAAVFIPIIVWQGEVGELLRDVAYAIAIAVIISLVVSVLVIPSLCARFLKPKAQAQDQAQDQVDASSSQAPEAKERAQQVGLLGQALRMASDARGAIAGAARWMSRSSIRSLGVVALALVLSVGATLSLLPKLEYLPRGNRNLIFGIILPPPGASVQEVFEVGKEYMTDVAAHVRVDRGDGVPSIERSFFVGAPEQIFSGAVAEDPAQVQGVLKYLRARISRIPGMIGFAVQSSLFGNSIGGGRAIEVELSGAQLDAIIPLGQRMFGMVRQKVPGAQVRPLPSLDPGADELHVRPKRAQTASVALDGTALGLVVDAYVDGAILGEYGLAGEEKIDVVLRAASRRTGHEALRDVHALASAPVSVGAGQVVPLEAFAQIVEGTGPTVIRRIERRRAVTLQITPPEEVPLEAAIEVIERDIVQALRDQGALPDTIQVRIAGTADKLKLARARFLLILLVAFAISYLLLAALFEDFLAPIPVLITVPLAAAGGIAALRAVDAYLSAQQLDLMSALGFLILIGVVVNNAILVVDGALANLRRGARLEDAVYEGVRSRVRPIFMSTTTSLAGLAPMVFIAGDGSELYRGVGAIVLGGLGVSSALTLFVVPCLFTLVWRLRAVGASQAT